MALAGSGADGPVMRCDEHGKYGRAHEHGPNVLSAIERALQAGFEQPRKHVQDLRNSCCLFLCVFLARHCARDWRALALITQAVLEVYVVLTNIPEGELLTGFVCDE